MIFASLSIAANGVLLNAQDSGAEFCKLLPGRVETTTQSEPGIRSVPQGTCIGGYFPRVTPPLWYDLTEYGIIISIRAAIVQQDVSGENGATIPHGTAMTFVVDRSKPATSSEKAQFSIAAESVPLAGDQHPVKATIDAVTIKEKSQSLMGALVGAAAAAAATRAGGGNAKTTIGGAVAGGAAGAVIGNQIRTGNGCIEKNAPIRITLSSDIVL